MKNYIEWSDKIYATGVNFLDEQHKKMFSMLNQLFFMMQENANWQDVIRVIDQLANYAEEHFKAEEQYFCQLKLKSENQHRCEHHDFLIKVKKFRKDYENGKLSLGLDVFFFVKDWIDHHIKAMDSHYSISRDIRPGEFLRAKI